MPVLKHIVMWNILGDTAEEKARNTQRLKAAFEGAKSTRGDDFQAWMYANASKVDTLIAANRIDASPSSHFLFGPGAFTMIEAPHMPRADGLLRRARC